MVSLYVLHESHHPVELDLCSNGRMAATSASFLISSIKTNKLTIKLQFQ